MIPIAEDLQKNDRNSRFCRELRDDINKDFPHNAAFLDSPQYYTVVVTEEYYESCLAWVGRHCKIKKEIVS